MKTTLAVLVCLIGSVAILFAQSGPSSAQQQSAVSTINAVGQNIWTDYAFVDAGALMVGGWAYECSAASPGTVDIVIDGQPVTPGYLNRIQRQDVWNWAVSNGFCPAEQMPLYTGVDTLLDLSGVASGWHTTALRVRNANGVVTVAAKSLPFYKP